MLHRHLKKLELRKWSADEFVAEYERLQEAIATVKDMRIVVEARVRILQLLARVALAADKEEKQETEYDNVFTAS